MTELQELTKTAFMMKIIAAILPSLLTETSSSTVTKRDLILLLGDEIGDLMTVHLKRERALTRTELLAVSNSDSHTVGKAAIILQRVALNALTDSANRLLKLSGSVSVEIADSRPVQEQLAAIAEALSEADLNALVDDSEADASQGSPLDKLRSRHGYYCAVLKRVFQPRLVTRFSIFAAFMVFWVEREAQKMLGAGGTISADDICRDAPRLAERLAIEMTRNSQPKVTYAKQSEVAAIQTPSVWDQFFADESTSAGKALTQLRKAAPISQSGNVYSMVHKSIQEYLVAKQLMDEIESSIKSSRLSSGDAKLVHDRLVHGSPESSSTANAPGSIDAWITDLAARLSSEEKSQETGVFQTECSEFAASCIHNGFRSVDDLVETHLSESNLKELGLCSMRLRLLAAAKLEEGASVGTTENRHKASIQRALGFPTGITDTEHTRCTDSVIRLIDILEASVLNSISLTTEEAVIDFATDRLAEDVRLTQAFGTLAALAVHGEDLHGGRLDRLADNVRAICFAPIARRGGGCLGHHAVLAANRELVVVWATVGLADKSTAWVEGWYGTKCATAATKLGAGPITETLLRVACPESLRSGAKYDAKRRGRGCYDESVSIAVVRRPIPKLTDEEAAALAALASRVVEVLALRRAWQKVPAERRMSELTDVAANACALIVDETQVAVAEQAQQKANYESDDDGDEVWAEPAEPSFKQWCGFSTYGEIVEDLREKMMLDAEQASAALSDPPDAALWIWSWFGNPQARPECQEAASEPSESGSLLDVADALGRSALAVAARKGHADIVGVLADSSMGTSANSTDKSGVRVLLHAAEQNNADCVRILLANRVARTGELGQNGDGQSALWVAARHNARDCCVLLAEADPEHSFSPDAKDTVEGLHPLDVAIAHGNLHCVDGMVERALAASQSDLVSAFAQSRGYTLDTTGSRIDLSAKGLVDADVALVSPWLRWLSSSDDGMDVVELDISQNKFGAMGAEFLAECLREATAALTSLALGSNQVGDEAMIGLLEALKDVSLTSLDISSTGCGISTASKLAELLSGATKFSAAVADLNISMNTIGGGRTVTLAPDASTIDTLEVGCVSFEEGGFYEIVSLENGKVQQKDVQTGEVLDDEYPVEELETDEVSVYAATDVITSGPFGDLCEALKTSQVTSLNLSECGLSSVELAELAEYVRDATATIVSVNCLANHFGDEGLATLLTAIEGTSVRSMCGLTEGQTAADFSGQNLSPIDCKILAAEFDFRGFIAAIESLDLSGCGLTGATNRSRWRPQENIDSDMDGWIALCSVLGKVLTVRLADCGLGGASAAELEKMVVSPRAGSITESVDLSGCAIDPTATAQLLSAASEASRLRLRNAQVLAFSAALHERLGADCVIQCNDLIVDVWRKVAEGVRARHGHEVLCSQLASHQPWYEMRVRGLVAEGVPGQ
jgi:hypothetical protein